MFVILYHVQHKCKHTQPNLKILKNKSPAQAYIVNPKPTKPTHKQNETNLQKKKHFMKYGNLSAHRCAFLE